MRSARLIILAIALVAGVVAFMLVRNISKAPETEVVEVARTIDVMPVLVAAKDLKPGSVISPQDVEWQDWPESSIPNLIRKGERPEAVEEMKGAVVRSELVKGEPIRLSAEHGEGMPELYSVLQPLADAFAERAEAEAPETETDVSDEDPDAPRVPTRAKPLQIAVVGRPNAGKSTLINAILGEDRLLTGPEAGITRDSISVQTDWQGTPMRIFDTAGMRKKAKVQEKLEKLSVSDGLRAVKFAEVVVVLLDAAIPFETQDLVEAIAKQLRRDRAARSRQAPPRGT